MATLVISEIKNSIRSPESDDLLQLIFVLRHASTFVRNQFYIFNFQITLKSIVTIFSVEHHYYKSNPNCERHGFTSPGASQAGSNIRKSNFQKFSLYSHTSWEIKKCMIMMATEIVEFFIQGLEVQALVLSQYGLVVKMYQILNDHLHYSHTCLRKI